MDEDYTDEDPMDALRKLFRELGIPDNGDPTASGAFQQILHRFSPSNEPSDKVIWDTAHQVARQQVASLGPDPTPGSRVTRSVADSVRLVELWLSDHTSFSPVALPPVTWSRAEWIEATIPAWRSMIEPVVATLSTTFAAATESRMEGDAPDDIAQLQSMLHPMLGRAIDTMFGAHVGQGLGQAATVVLTGTDLGLPVMGKPQIAVLPTNITGLDQATDLPQEDLLLYCCLREAARQRLFTETGWISVQIVALVQHYARETEIDPDRLASTMESAMPDQLSPTTIAAFQADLSDILFRPEVSEDQKAILARLNTLLGLVEGWVDHVVSNTAAQWLPSHRALAESLRRHRATNRQADAIVTPFIGMNVSVGAIREAADFWEAARQARGVDGRDEIWRHPDSLPTPEQISAPQTYFEASATSSDDLDDELRKLLGDSSDQ
ncbi:MAG: zinc-dependent metalloprotease [Propionibacteriaceae bacterium]|jgi:putative hydrolase|nr:zinc-dependent metalloprotease [Propionibacteriaceae bacterium]